MNIEINEEADILTSHTLANENNNSERCCNCVVFATHKINDEILRYLSFLKRGIDGVMDLLVLYDCSLDAINPADYPDLQFYIFDSRCLEDFFHQNNKLLPNTLIPLIECAKQNKYEHYLLMENDIVLHGNFNTFIQKVNEDSHVDYIHIANDVLGGPENHWPIKYIQNNPFENLYFSWSQLFYVSYQYLMELKDFINNNNSINYEFLLPTMAYNRKFVIKQFENYGYQFQLSWGPAEVYEYRYNYERMNNTFYHPIKNLEIVNFG